MSTSSRRIHLRQIFGTNTTAVVDTFGSGLRPYLPAALATPWHANRPPNYAEESKFAWSGRTGISTLHHARHDPPQVPLEVIHQKNALLHFHIMVAHLAGNPGSVDERAAEWVRIGCSAFLCYTRCWDPAALEYLAPLLTILSLPGFPLEPVDFPKLLRTKHKMLHVTPPPPFDIDDGTTSR